MLQQQRVQASSCATTNTAKGFQARSDSMCLQIPIGGEADFAGVFDLVRMKAITWNGEVCLKPPLQMPRSGLCLLRALACFKLIAHPCTAMCHVRTSSSDRPVPSNVHCLSTLELTLSPNAGAGGFL